MPRYIIKLHDEVDDKDYFLEWSTVVDAPVTYGLSLDDFKQYYKEQYGIQGMRDFDERMERVEKNGISAHPPFDNLDSEISRNRAGDNEVTLSKEQIIERYCRNKEQVSN